MKYIIRILVLPFLACITSIGLIIWLFKYLYHFLLNGGEFIVYLDKNEPETIGKIYTLLKKQNEKNKN
jgi:hypothetical protein